MIETLDLFKNYSNQNIIMSPPPNQTNPVSPLLSPRVSHPLSRRITCKECSPVGFLPKVRGQKPSVALTEEIKQNPTEIKQAEVEYKHFALLLLQLILPKRKKNATQAFFFQVQHHSKQFYITLLFLFFFFTLILKLLQPSLVCELLLALLP